jgi:RNA polymerase-binding transcription factor DksA
VTPTPPPDEIRDRLVRLRHATLRRAGGLSTDLESIVDAVTDVATDDEHDPEGHTIAWERQQVAALLAQARADLSSVEAALDRLDTGGYGSCERCGESIGDARLEALPEVTTCIDCARRGP